MIALAEARQAGHPGLDAVEVAARIGRSRYQVEEVLQDCRARGLARTDADGRWRLSDEAERLFGAALRGLTTP